MLPSWDLFLPSCYSSTPYVFLCLQNEVGSNYTGGPPLYGNAFLCLRVYAIPAGRCCKSGGAGGR